MERGNRSLKALQELKFIDSQEPTLKGDLLLRWAGGYLLPNGDLDFDIQSKDLKILSELIYKNIIFLKQQRVAIANELNEYHKIKQFLQ